MSAALVIQNAKRVHRIMSSVACPAVQYFSTLFNTWYHFREKFFEHKKHILILSKLLSEIFLILRRIERDMTTHVHRSSCSEILMKLEYSRQIFEKSSNAKFHENTPNGIRTVPCSRADRQTDRQTSRYDELTVVFAILRTIL